jgi:Domain of unknown function (DUF4177)
MGHSSCRSRLAVGLAALLIVASVVDSPCSMRAQEPERPLPPEPRVRPETKLVPQRQWEYRQLPCMLSTVLAARDRGDFVDQLNDSGRHGWELVSVVELRHVPGRECLLATFKRPVLN